MLMSKDEPQKVIKFFSLGYHKRHTLRLAACKLKYACWRRLVSKITKTYYNSVGSMKIKVSFISSCSWFNW